MMGRGTDQLLAAAGQLVDAAAQTTQELVSKGKEQADMIALENHLKKAERQLGALVYSLEKAGDQNEALIKKYVDEIDRTRSQLASRGQRKDDPVSVHKCPSCGTGVAKDAMFCRRCGEKLS